MFKVKSFIKSESVAHLVETSATTGVKTNVIQTEEPAVLISAKDLYRMIYGRDASTASIVTNFINKIKYIDKIDDYNEALETELMSIEVDMYCKGELEDAAFLTGDYGKDKVAAVVDKM
jgi:hypothetical protein